MDQTFNEQQLQVLDAIKCPITRQIMENLMRRAKDAPVNKARAESRATKASKRR